MRLAQYIDEGYASQDRRKHIDECVARFEKIYGPLDGPEPDIIKPLDPELLAWLKGIDLASDGE